MKSAAPLPCGGRAKVILNVKPFLQNFDAQGRSEANWECIPAWNCAEPYEVDCKQPTWLAGH